MKVRKSNRPAESKELLLREYFLNAYLIALLKQAGNQVRLQRMVTEEERKEVLEAA
ncbi:MAG: hypothetical protein OSA48_02005 [Akkermansiaceae bacterium]|nr:hypothetical protein [Akkermansiaceae bacterium]|tara:strand:+ start:411 stop:578 length:168 start_codon:yes stop_codon:yes gene_type:complete